MTLNEIDLVHSILLRNYATGLHRLPNRLLARPGQLGYLSKRAAARLIEDTAHRMLLAIDIRPADFAFLADWYCEQLVQQAKADVRKAYHDAWFTHREPWPFV